jgi:NAD+ diphosphatase
MIGLTGQYAGGTLQPDGDEITDARWFGPGELPWLPRKGSISRRIIDWFVEVYG